MKQLPKQFFKSALDWFIEHRDMIPQMSKEAYETAQKINVGKIS